MELQNLVKFVKRYLIELCIVAIFVLFGAIAITLAVVGRVP